MLLMTAPVSGRAATPDPGQAHAIVEAVYRFRWQLEPEHFPAFDLHAGDPARRPWSQELRPVPTVLATDQTERT